MTINALTATSIALVLLYLQLALLVTATTELISNILDYRRVDLDRWLTQSLEPELAKRLKAHPMLKTATGKRTFFNRSGKQTPDWIPTEAFARAVDAILKENPTLSTPPDFALFRHGDQIKNIGDWFDAGMERLKDEYLRWVRQVNLAVGLILAFALNADSLYVMSTISADPQQQAEVMAQGTAQANAPAPTVTDVPTQIQQAASAKIGSQSLSWGRTNLICSGLLGVLAKLVGLTLTGIATSLGAPFWFDLLRKVAGGR